MTTEVTVFAAKLQDLLEEEAHKERVAASMHDLDEFESRVHDERAMIYEQVATLVRRAVAS
jgi:hypothetical protein